MLRQLRARLVLAAAEDAVVEVRGVRVELRGGLVLVAAAVFGLRAHLVLEAAARLDVDVLQVQLVGQLVGLHALQLLVHVVPKRLLLTTPALHRHAVHQVHHVVAVVTLLEVQFVARAEALVGIDRHVVQLLARDLVDLGGDVAVEALRDLVEVLQLSRLAGELVLLAVVVEVDVLDARTVALEVELSHILQELLAFVLQLQQLRHEVGFDQPHRALLLESHPRAHLG